MAVGFERAFPGASPEQIERVAPRLADSFEEFFERLRPVDELESGPLA
jgi:hypothetical protein